MPDEQITFRELGLCDYEPVLNRMLEFTDQRTDKTPDEIWLLEHNPVYTLGKNAKKHHILNAGNIPIVQVDRGGQVTYHGPGQLVAYLLLDIRRKGFGVRQVVTAMENSIIHLLADLGISSVARPDAPGVYVKDEKIAALGLRIRNGRSYHGLSLNFDMDLTPFTGINPCGFEGMQVTQIRQLQKEISMSAVKQGLVNHLRKNLQAESE